MLAQIPKPGRSFYHLAQYLLFGKKGSTRNPHRVGWVAARNLIHDDPLVAAKIMAGTASLSARTQRAVYHMILSFHPSEMPTPEEMQAMCGVMLENLGLGEHQAILVGHEDTNNPHVHMMVNRVHADSGRAWKTSHDYARVERLVAQLADEYGFMRVPGRHNNPEDADVMAHRPPDGDFHRATRTKVPKRKAFSKAQQSEIARDLAADFETAASWQDLADRLAARGFSLVAKGQGLVLTDGVAQEMKLSALGKNIRLKSLQERFGTRFADYAREVSQRSAETRPARAAEALEDHAESAEATTATDNSRDETSDFKPERSKRARKPRTDKEQVQREPTEEALCKEKRPARLDPRQAYIAQLARRVEERREAARTEQREPPSVLAALIAELVDMRPASTASRPLVSATDIVLAFRSMGLLSKEDVDAHFEELEAEHDDDFLPEM